jgi:proteasome lid subunit RPN8/RPN11
MARNTQPQGIRITVEDWEEMHSDVELKIPEEACGLIAGTLGTPYYQALAVLPLTNSLHSPVRFKIEPQEQLAAFNTIDASNWELVGIYHSHPLGPDTPSATDVDESYYPEAVQLIWSKRTGAWKCRGFLIQQGAIHEISLLLAR